MADVVRITGIPSGQISTAKNSNALPNAEFAYKLAKALNTTVEYLVTGETISNDPSLDLAFEDIRLGKRTRDIALILPSLKDKDADVIIAMLDSLGYEIPKHDLQEG